MNPLKTNLMLDVCFRRGQNFYQSLRWDLDPPPQKKAKRLLSQHLPFLKRRDCLVLSPPHPDFRRRSQDWRLTLGEVWASVSATTLQNGDPGECCCDGRDLEGK